MSTKLEAAARLALEALEEIALAGMSPPPKMIEGKEAYRARQAWSFIGTAAKALEPVKEALAEYPAQLQEQLTHEYRKGFVDGQIDMRKRQGQQPAHQPLTDAAIDSLYQHMAADERTKPFTAQNWFQAGVASAEAALGITGSKT